MNKYKEEKKYTSDGRAVKNVIKNGTTTVVYGQVQVDDNLKERVYKSLNLACILVASNVESTKGVAKCQPGDKYDENVGVTVASRKAEVKARGKYLNALSKAEKLLEEALAEIRAERENTANRVAKVSEELKKF